jgi:Kef-type K+ transport system membrane component KefB
MEYMLFARTVLLLHDNHLAIVGLCVLGAVLVAELCGRFFHFPLITGYLLTGIALGPIALNIVNRPELQQLAFFSDIAIGIMLFELGRHLDWQWLRREPRLMALALFESIAVFAAVYGLLLMGGMQQQAASLLAIIAMTASPIVLLAIIGETRAEGRVSDWACVFAAVNNCLALLLSALFVPLLRAFHEDAWETMLAGPLRDMAASAGLGVIMGMFLMATLRLLRGKASGNGVPALFLFGAILTNIGLAEVLGVTPLMATLLMGAVCRNADQGKALLGINIEPIRGLFVCVLFIQVGAGLNPYAWRDIAPWAGAFLAIRGVVRIAATWLFGPLSGISRRQAAMLGVALLPMSSLAVLTVHASVVALPEMDKQVTAITAAALVVLELLGPFCTRWALRRVGEVTPATGVSNHG